MGPIKIAILDSTCEREELHGDFSRAGIEVVSYPSVEYLVSGESQSSGITAILITKKFIRDGHSLKAIFKVPIFILVLPSYSQRFSIESRDGKEMLGFAKNPEEHFITKGGSEVTQLFRKLRLE